MWKWRQADRQFLWDAEYFAEVSSGFDRLGIAALNRLTNMIRGEMMLLMKYMEMHGFGGTNIMNTRSGLFVLALVFTAVMMSCDDNHLWFANQDHTTDSTRFDSLEKALKYPERAITLDVEGDTATALPVQLKLLPNMKFLRWERGRLTAIPSFIGDLQSVLKMAFWYNAIDTIAPEIGKLKNLLELSVSYNNLSYLPEEICNMEGLGVLSVHHNNLIVLPDSIHKLKKLWFLKINNNPISREEIERIRKALPNLKKYYHD